MDNYTLDLFDYCDSDGPVDCLGMHFESDKERKAYFKEQLRLKLSDPDFRNIEGFPLGEVEDIVAISDPPYYCACPNPWMADIISEWESKKVVVDESYYREPFASDVSEGKNDPTYDIHSYHTKVPYKAIMRYILHYTNPGDIVYDGFCGSGMTALAARECNNKKIISELGYLVNGNKVLDSNNKFVTEIGTRNAVLNDLSPAASLISNSTYGCNDIDSVIREAESILDQVEEEYGWMYKTKISEHREADIHYVVWSDVFICPECGKEIVYFNSAINEAEQKMEKEFYCPHCNTLVSKQNLIKAEESVYDCYLHKVISRTKQVPVLINYGIGTKRGLKRVDANDLALVEKIEKTEDYNWVPIDELPNGFNTNQPRKSHGITNVHQFYTKRNLLTLAAIYSKIHSPILKFWFTSGLLRLSRLYKFMPKFTKNGVTDRRTGPLSGTLYVPSLGDENSPFYFYRSKLKDLKKIQPRIPNAVISTQSSTGSSILANSIDYIFLDPPFGSNLNYSELSFIWESWLQVFTNNKEEAIENSVQGKGINEYRTLMQACFSEAFRILKPGRWTTIEFSNTDSKVWNSIQTALSDVGFIVANVSALDKQQGSFKAVKTPTAVKQDLVISCYKPDEDFEKQVISEVGEEAVWTFVRKHLTYLPLVKEQGESTITVPERDPRIIYDRLVSFFVSHNMLLPISSPDFLQQIGERFVVRDGLCYLPVQVIEYEKLLEKKKIQIIEEDASLFVEDERTAISWIRRQLKERPRTLGELTPLFMQQLSAWSKFEKKLELSDILQDNFFEYMGEGPVPGPIHSHLSTFYKDMRNLEADDPILKAKAKGYWCIPDPKNEAQISQVRERHLLKEFDSYLLTKGKIKNNTIRVEAVRAGFKRAYSNKDYQTIVSFAERMPVDIIESDDKLLLWFNNAAARLE